jgi:hypothetical protein
MEFRDPRHAKAVRRPSKTPSPRSPDERPNLRLFDRIEGPCHNHQVLERAGINLASPTGVPVLATRACCSWPATFVVAELPTRAPVYGKPGFTALDSVFEM